MAGKTSPVQDDKIFELIISELQKSHEIRPVLDSRKEGYVLHKKKQMRIEEMIPTHQRRKHRESPIKSEQTSRPNPCPFGTFGIPPANPLRGQEECRKQAGIGHWGR
jgi:hypothetical protein